METIKKPDRIASVDVFRVIAILAVITIHAKPFMEGVYKPNPDEFMNFGLFINQLVRFGVPFFFVISGYFFASKIDAGANLRSTSLSMMKRVFVLFLFWSLVYLMPYNLTVIPEYGYLGPAKTLYWSLKDQLHDPINLALQGPRMHLWFLVSLIMAIGITASLYRKKAVLVVVALALYVFGVLGQAYAASPVGVHPGFETRNGPFMSTLFFVLGCYMARLKPQQTWLYWGLLMLAVGTAIHFAELYLLWVYYHASADTNYVFGTLLMGTGLAMAAVSNHPFVRTQSLSSAGLYTLGVYGLHIVVKDLFSIVNDYTASLYWEASKVFLIYGVTLLIVWVMAKNKWLRKVCT